MFYSLVHDWQAAANVKQILVFPLSRDLYAFEKNLITDERPLPYTDSQFNDGDVTGVFVKLRAVQNGDGKWIPIIRTSDSTLIQELPVSFDNWQDALKKAKISLKSVV